MRLARVLDLQGPNVANVVSDLCQILAQRADNVRHSRYGPTNLRRLTGSVPKPRRLVRFFRLLLVYAGSDLSSVYTRSDLSSFAVTVAANFRMRCRISQAAGGSFRIA